MSNKKLTKEQLAKLKELLQQKQDNWKRGDDGRIASQFGCSRYVVAWHRRELGMYYATCDEIAQYIKSHKDITIREVAKKFKVSATTVRKVDKSYNLGLTKTHVKVTITQADVEGKTFKEVKQMLGVTDSYLCHIKQRHNLTFAKKQGERDLCGKRKNLLALRHSSVDDIAEILSVKPWCEKELCAHNCAQCCKQWLLKRDKSNA